MTDFIGPQQLVIITEHADERLKERLSLPKSARQSATERAYLKGKTHKDAKGRLKRFLDGRWLEHKSANNMRLYMEHVWFFSNNKLITLYEIPKHLRGGM